MGGDEKRREGKGEEGREERRGEVKREDQRWERRQGRGGKRREKK